MENVQDKLEFKFGLVGKDISYSFSRSYFAEKFIAEQLPYTYDNFDLETIDQFKGIVQNTQNLKGLNVTIPYKETVIPFLDKLDKRAKKIGAVNTIKILKCGKLKGFNTDYYGFKKSLEPHLKYHHKKALILGTGGASKAVAFALKRLNICYHFVSRTKKKNVKFEYNDLNTAIISKYTIIINCTPLGTHPNINNCPDIPYDAITTNHILYDLIYNPSETKFLQCGKLKGATIINGLKMLELQAEKAWTIWNSS